MGLNRTDPHGCPIQLALFLAALLLAGGFCFGLSAPSPAMANDPCRDVVLKELDARSVPRDDMAEVRYFQQTGRAPGFGARRSQVTGYDAWVSFHSCEGNLVLQLNRWCQLQTSYWRGNCAATLGKGAKSSGGN